MDVKAESGASSSAGPTADELAAVSMEVAVEQFHGDPSASRSDVSRTKRTRDENENGWKLLLLL